MAEQKPVPRTFRFTVFYRDYLEQGKELRPGLGIGVFATDDYIYRESEQSYSRPMFQMALEQKKRVVLDELFIVKVEQVDATDNQDNRDDCASPRAATAVLFERYLSVCKSALQNGAVDRRPDDPEDTGLQHLANLCATALEMRGIAPIDKLSRWLGFVQAVLAMRGLASVQEERDFSRPLFHAAYRKLGFDVPETVDVDAVGQAKAG